MARVPERKAPRSVSNPSRDQCRARTTWAARLRLRVKAVSFPSVRGTWSDANAGRSPHRDQHGPGPPARRDATDQYVPKHFPFKWHSSLAAVGDCNGQHIASQYDPANGLFHDLQKESTTQAFSWISPNNCSDAHDAVCHGNNLSGGMAAPNTPNPPANHTDGLSTGRPVERRRWGDPGGVGGGHRDSSGRGWRNPAW